ncbi:hypothetical protein STHERM_c17780 [Spirochaeta thermophila DSM 6192]|uniref:Metallo-beta-lactamase domain-containing protein n=2 Tax=Winmispira thermophila TaxID=154 RepID=E0RP51_WINT6|nr:hypothetical protein STHERM_c17780 [Spirochaeta thermophila DSM 6192]
MWGIPHPAYRSSNREHQWHRSLVHSLPLLLYIPMPLRSFSYKSTHYYLVEGEKGLLAFDVGWPGTIRSYIDGLKSLGFTLSDLSCFMVSHFHIDHAGIAGELQSRGIPFLVFPSQEEAIAGFESFMARKGMAFTPIDLEALERVPFEESRRILATWGIGGEVLPTPVHSADSVSLLLDGGEVAVGDMPPAHQLAEEEGRAVWRLVGERGGRRAFPAHGRPFPVEERP